MKFRDNRAKYHNIYYEINFEYWGKSKSEKSNTPYYVTLTDTKEGISISTEYTHRFATAIEAEDYCEELSKIPYALHMLIDEEQQAKNIIHEQQEQKLKQSAIDFKKSIEKYNISDIKELFKLVDMINNRDPQIDKYLY